MVGKAKSGLFNYVDLPFGLLCIAGLAGIVLGGPTGIDIVCAVLVLLSLCGGTHTVIALALCAVVRFLNPELAMPSGNVSAASWLILIVGFVRNLPYIVSPRYFGDIWSIWLLSVCALISSLVASHSLMISALKLISFFMGVTLLIAVMRGVPVRALDAFRRRLTTLYIVVMLASFPLLFVFSIGFAFNGVGFQGIFNQAQTFAIYLAPAFVYLVARLFEKRPLSILHLALIAMAGVMLFASRARTGALASLLAISLATFYVITVQVRARLKLNTFRVLALPVLALLVVASLYAYSPTAREKIIGYVFKYENKTSFDKAFEESRGGLVTHQLENFQKSPLLGNGFGVDPNPLRKLNKAKMRDTMIFGIPLSAPVEKGFVFTAVLEEMGIIGFTIFLVALVHLTLRASRTHDIAYLALFLTCICVNFGEAVFFSIGGIGVHFWILLAFVLGVAGRTPQRVARAGPSALSTDGELKTSTPA